MTADVGFRVDCHVKVLDEGVVRRAKRRDLDALVYAPHFIRLPEIERRAATHSDDDLLVVPARELFTGDWRNRKHVLAVGLEEPVPDFLTLEAAMAELDRQGAAVLVPHPTFMTVSLGPEEVDTYRSVVDGIEVYNPKHWPHHNRRAQSLASETGLAPFASSYAHLPGTVGEAWTSFPEPLRDATAVADALRDGMVRRAFHRRGRTHRLRCLAEFAHLGHENSVKKVDRVLLSGMEPTHPHHEAYGGRFDDAAVY